MADCSTAQGMLAGVLAATESPVKDTAVLSKGSVCVNQGVLLCRNFFHLVISIENAPDDHLCSQVVHLDLRETSGDSQRGWEQ